jgi:hypothetical protein
MANAATRDRRGSVGLAMTAAVAVIASFIAGKAARDAILLSNFPVTSLPLFVGIAAALSIPLVLLSGRLMVRFGPARLMTSLNAVSAAALIGEWVLLQQYPRAAAVVTFFHLSTLGAVLVSGFWSIINEQFDAQTAKKNIGRIGMAATLGGIAGGLIAERTSAYLQPGAILLVLAGLQALCAVVLFWLSGGQGASEPEDDEDELTGWSALKHVARSSLLRNLAFVIVLDAIAAAVLDYVFKAEVTEATGAQGTLRFFGIFYTATNVITALVQLVGARPVVEKLGVARSVATLPATVTLASIGAFAAPGLLSTVIARGSEMVTRSSLYRAAYELLYAPLLEQRKRSTKVILDVGAERIGDLLGAQVVALVIFTVPDPRDVLMICAIGAGFVAALFASRLPRSYTKELEHSLRTRAGQEPGAGKRAPYRGMPTLTEAGDFTGMSLVNMRASAIDLRASSMFNAPAFDVSEQGMPTFTPGPVLGDAMTPAVPPPVQDEVPAHELVHIAAGLCSKDASRIKRTLGSPLPPELAAMAVPLIGRDEVAAHAIRALRKIAKRATGVLVDALHDPNQALAVRRRIPGILESGDPELARWALWRGLADPQFEVRYRCGRVLARMEKTGAARIEDVFAAVKREIEVDAEVWKSHKLANDDDDDDDDDDDTPPDAEEVRVLRELMRRSSHGLEHIFTLLGLALPADPLRIALQALYTDEGALRSTALEYLESVLPPEIRAALWPLIESTALAQLPVTAPGTTTRPREEIIDGLRMSQPMILENLRKVAVRDGLRAGAAVPAERAKNPTNPTSPTNPASPTKDREPYNAVIRGHKSSLRTLFETSHASTPELAGRYVLKLTIAQTGAVTRAEVTSQPSGDGVSKFVSALVAEARTWKFPASLEQVVISYPFVFDATK